MLNDITLHTLEKEAVDTILSVTKEIFSEHIPYRLYPSSVDRNDKIIVFNKHLVEVFRLVLSNPDAGCIIQMSDAERDVYYSYVEFVNGTSPVDPEMLAVVTELDNCLVNEVECKVETYLQQCFDTTHAWETCTLDTNISTQIVKLTQEAYDENVADDTVIDTTIYLIVLDSVTIKIILAGIILWQV